MNKQTKKPRVGQCVLIKWIDSCAHIGWTDKDGRKELDVSECLSIGWIVTMTKTGITIAPHVTGCRLTNGHMTIVRSTVKNITRLKLPDFDKLS